MLTLRQIVRGWIGISIATSIGSLVVWPPVLPVHKTYTFVHPGQDRGDTPARVFVLGTSSDTLYRIECHNGNYNDTYDLAFSGDIQCALWGVKNGELTTGNLFADSTNLQQESEWFNRGRLLAKQVSGQCASYPEFGLIRHFRTRGMSIALELGDIRWSFSGGKRRLDKFTIDITVEPDSTAQSETSEMASAPIPPRACGW